MYVKKWLWLTRGSLFTYYFRYYCMLIYSYSLTNNRLCKIKYLNKTWFSDPSIYLQDVWFTIMHGMVKKTCILVTDESLIVTTSGKAIPIIILGWQPTSVMVWYVGPIILFVFIKFFFLLIISGTSRWIYVSFSKFRDAYKEKRNINSSKLSVALFKTIIFKTLCLFRKNTFFQLWRNTFISFFIKKVLRS